MNTAPKLPDQIRDVITIKHCSLNPKHVRYGSLPDTRFGRCLVVPCGQHQQVGVSVVSCGRHGGQVGAAPAPEYGQDGVRFFTRTKTGTQRWPRGGAVTDQSFAIPTMR